MFLRRFLYLSLLFSFYFSHSVAVAAQGTGEKSSIERLKKKKRKKRFKYPRLKIYRPVLALTREDEQASDFIFSGRTLPKANVIVQVAENKEEVIAGRDGLFKTRVKIPHGEVEIVVGSFRKEKLIRKRKFRLEITEDGNIKFKNYKKRISQSPLFVDRYGLWLGVGYNILIYKQSTTDISDLQLDSIKGPSFYGKYWHRYNKNWKTNFTYNRAPGEAVNASAGLALGQSKEYNWEILVGEVAYYPDSWYAPSFGGISRGGVLFGLQHHTVPFIARTGNTNTEAEILTNEIFMASAGAEYTLSKGKWLYEVFMRYQHPVSSGSLFTVAPNFAFDGSVGAFYKFSDRWRLGAFWYGQWQDYDFQYDDKYITANPSLGTNPVSGNQSLFFSNIEIRLGVRF